MKIPIWLCIIHLSISTAISQGSGDSLRMLIRDSKHSGEIWNVQNYMAQLAWTFIQKGQLDSAKKYYNATLVEAPIEDVRFRANLKLALGTIYHSKEQFDSAIYFYRTCVEHQGGADSATFVIATTNLSDVLIRVGLYEEALSAAFQTLSIIENGKPTIALGSCYNSIGSIQTKIGNYDDAGIYYRKALAVRNKIAHPIEVARSFNNIGELFILTQQYDSAEINLQRSANIKRQISDRMGLGRTLSNLGKVAMHTGKTFAAENYLKESQSIGKTTDDPIGMIETLNNLGELYLNLNKPQDANNVLREANMLIHKSGTPEYLRQNLELRIRLSRTQKNFAEGMTLLEELLIIRDSLLNEEKSKSLQAMQIRYETQKKEQEIALLEQRREIDQARIESNRILIVSLIAGLVLFAIIGILIYINLKNARAAKTRFELLLAETRHRIKNNLQTLASIFHLQTRHYTDQEMVLEARNSESRVHAMSLLHERFYASDAEHTVNTRDYITDLANKLVDIYGSGTRTIRLSLNVEDVELDIDKALALSLIIQELVCNAFKYAFDHEPNPELSINLQVNDDKVIVTVHDNGIGFNRTPVGTSHGLNLVDALVAQLDGEVQINNQPGTTFTIQFPATSLWKKRVFS